jgi:hypothetical protein
LVHPLLLALLAGYTLFGALCFCAFEAENERILLNQRQALAAGMKDEARQSLVSDLR